jgi:peroxiredoxin
MEPDIKAKNVQLFVIDIGENARTVKRYAERNNISLDIYLDRDTAVASKYDVVGVPSFIFINSEGMIVDIRHDLPMKFEEIFLSQAE